MYFEKVSDDSVNKLYRRTHMTRFLDEFIDSGYKIAKVTFNGEYSSIESARASICRAVTRLRYPIVIRTINGEVYLINTALSGDQISTNK